MKEDKNISKGIKIMRRKFNAIVCILLAIFALQIFTGCEKTNRKINNSYVKFFHFVTEDNTFLFDYQLDGYFSSDKLQNKINEFNNSGRQIEKITYLDGTTFSVNRDDINDYFVHHDPDTTVNAKVFVSKDDYPAYTVVVKMKLTEYQITWKGIENATLIAPSFYTIDMIGSPLPIPTKEHMVFMYWYIEDESSTPNIKTTYENLGNVTYIAKWEAKQIHIIYEDDDKTHDNEENILLQNGTYTLKPLANHPSYLFHGWKLNDEYVTELDPVKLWVEGKGTVQDIILVADIEYIKHTFTFYNEDKTVLETFHCTYDEWLNFTSPLVPSKEHYVGSWDSSLDEFKDYDIYPKYELEKYKITFQTNIDGYNIEDKECTYGTTYQDLLSQLSFSNKHLIGVYTDSARALEVDYTALIDQDITLYIYLSDKYIIETKEDWKLITEHPDGYFELANDINFMAEAIPTVDEFSGIIDGKECTVSNFVNSNLNCPSSYGIFGNNRGTISNLNFYKFTFTISNQPTDGTIHLGFLTGNNYGNIRNVNLSDGTITIVTYHSSQGGELLNHVYAGVLAGSNYGTIDHCDLDASCSMTSKIELKGNKQPNLTARFFASYGLMVGGNEGFITDSKSSVYLQETVDMSESVTNDHPYHYSNIHYALQIGGISGYNASNGTITHCLDDSFIQPDFNIQRDGYFGGIVDAGHIAGTNAGVVEHSASSFGIGALVNAEVRLGGIVGTNEESGVVRAVFTASEFGVGRPENSAIVDSYVGCIVGLNSGIMTYCSVLRADFGTINLTGDNNYFGLLFGKANPQSTVANCIVNVSEVYAENVMCYAGGLIDDAVISNCCVFVEDEEDLNNLIDNWLSGIHLMNSKELLVTYFEIYDFATMGFAIVEYDYIVLPDLNNRF